MKHTEAALKRHDTRLNWFLFGLCMPFILMLLPIGEWEGKLYPVVSVLEIDVVEPIADGIRFSGSFDKLENCDIKSIFFYRRGANDVVELSFADGERPQNRTTGLHFFEGWQLHGVISLDEVEGVTEHWCHRHWPTITKIFP